ncbi:ribonuclease III [Candidatus Zixiibacteriota bacterium]
MSFWDKLKKLFESDNLFSEDKALKKTQKTIGYNFRQTDILAQALTHRSYHRQKEQYHLSNERLEYLGDSVLGLVIADRLYHDHPHFQEGRLTKTKAMLVNEITLSKVAQEIGLNRYIRMSPEEEKLGGRERPSIISDAFESIIGAVYLDGGYQAACDVVLRLIYTRKSNIVTDESQINYKGNLLELLQAEGRGMPRYEVISEKGPDHEKEFTVAVVIDGERVGSGSGNTKKEAEQKAASIALESIKNK